MDLAFVKEFAGKHEDGLCFVALDKSPKSINSSTLDLSHLKTEREHLSTWELLMDKSCIVVNLTDIVDYYVRMNFINCLTWYAPCLLDPTWHLAMCGLHYHNMAALQLAQTFGRYNSRPCSFFSFTLPQHAFDIWQDIVWPIGTNFHHLILKTYIQYIPQNQLKMLVHFSLKYKSPYTFQLINSIMTKDDYYKLLLLKQLCMTDVFPICALFMIKILCH